MQAAGQGFVQPMRGGQQPPKGRGKQVKAEHQLPSGLLQPVKIPLWKGKRVTMDFVSGMPLMPTKKDLIEILVSRLDSKRSYTRFWVQDWTLVLRFIPRKMVSQRGCRTLTCWTELGERRVLGLELVSDTEEKVKLIRDYLKAASDRQKPYANLKRREIEYSTGDFVFLKVFQWKKILRFRRKGKLSPKFIGSYRILKGVGLVAYQLELPSELDQIHDVFYMSMLRRYRSDPKHIVPVEEIEVSSDLTFEEEPVQILDREVKVLKKKSIPLVKVLWRNHNSEEATWEPKEVIRQQYPHLF
ncbi:uncharacterized protein LOC128040432 [Gossypium raimondii]|uniref:uncharacterized protein LOC128040432 n=1 Tax=Gossypium raimondii TaxID=29730 RepID=UPI00227C5BB5|nr:uncharacterized protein LOC128040432 [Gossypium raimondii]